MEHTATDRLDRILATWKTARADLDFFPLELVTRVLRAAHFLQTRLDRIASAYGLSHQGDLEVLTELDLAGAMAPSELADTLLLTTGGMTVRLNRLQAAGLVERHPNPRDGRSVLVRLTPGGKDLAEAALSSVLEAQTSIIGVLGPSDQNALVGLLRALLVGLGDIPAFSPTVVARQQPVDDPPVS